MPIASKVISYHQLQTGHADEAESLAFYLNEHGVCAQVVDRDAVEVPIPDRDTFDIVEILKTTWARFWAESDSGLWGLPVYEKPALYNPSEK